MRRSLFNIRIITRALCNIPSFVPRQRVNIPQCSLLHKNKPLLNSEYLRRRLCENTSNSLHNLNSYNFEEVCDETLDSLSEYFEQIVENCEHLESADVGFSDGVLTVHFGNPYGTYVINRQTPNQQIWLSSPTSGPKRYDFIDGKWIYHHDGVSLHKLLNEEIPIIVKCDVDFTKCSYSGHSDKKNCR